jgi:tetratricopeptide (TPR) repeat protein
VEHLFRKSLRFVVGFVVFATACQAEKSYLVVQVADLHGQPITGLELATKGSSESGTTDRLGRTRIKLDSQIKVNDWVAMQIVRSPKGKDLVLISPWDAHAQVPPFDNETVNFLPLVVATRGDRRLLENGEALTAIAAQINKANSPKIKDPDPEQQRKEALATIAKVFDLAPDEVDKAIRAWGERAINPYEKGLAALYEKNYPLASKELSQSLEMLEKEVIKAQAAAADSAFFFAYSKYQEGKFRESVTPFKKALRFRPDDNVVMSYLAVSLQQAGDFAEAEKLYRQVLSNDERSLRPDDPALANDLNNFGALLTATGNYEEAKRLYLRALSIDENHWGRDDPRLSTGYNNLAVLLMTIGDYAGAESFYRRALAIDEKALGKDSVPVAGDLNNIAALLEAVEDYQSAERLYRRALDIVKKAIDPADYRVATCQNNLGGLLIKARDDFEEAESLLLSAQAIDERSLGPNHPNVARDIANLAELRRLNHDYDGAESLLKRALVIYETELGPGHSSVAAILNGLALVLVEKRDYVGAEPLFRRALAIAEKALGPDHPTTRTIQNNLAVILEAKSKAAQPK